MRRLTICLLALSALAISVAAPEFADGRSVRLSQPKERLPCYVIISNEVREDNKRREIKVLIDKSDVNEANFVRLHRHFSAAYQDAENLSVSVHTSLNFTLGNYKTAEDIQALRAVLSGVPYESKPKVWEKDAQGILIRRGEVELFGYKAEGGSMKDMKYVLVKGEDPSCENCKRLEVDLRDGGETRDAKPGKAQSDLPCYFVITNFEMEGQRFIRLFINAEDGNEPNLLALLRLFSQQHPGPERLVIKVYTNPKQDSDFLVPGKVEYFSAALFRDSVNEVMRYRHPGTEVKTVVFKGVDVFPKLDDYWGTERRRP